MADTVALLNRNGIAVMSHIGLKPQFSRFTGGYKVSGRGEEGAREVLNDARALVEAGAVLLLVE